MKDDRIYLRHILECLDAIREYTAESPGRFLTDRKTQKATLRELQELAESTRRLSPRLKEKRPEIPWADIAGFKNVLVHDYLGLSLPRIWNIIERPLPPLRAAVEVMLSELEQRGPAA